MLLPEEDLTVFDVGGVKKMEDQNARIIEVKSYNRELYKPVGKIIRCKISHIYLEGVNLDECTEIGVETTDRISIRPLDIGGKNYFVCATTTPLSEHSCILVLR